jgi:hypothetical protein
VQEVTLTEISIDGSSVFSSDVSLQPGDFSSIMIPMNRTCGSASTVFELNSVRLTYEKGNITGFNMLSNVPIIGKCS